MAVSRIRLAMLGGPTPGGTAPSPRPASGAFGAPRFIPMRILAAEDDHIRVAAENSIRRYAIGHLPRRVRPHLMPGRILQASIAPDHERNALGLAEEAIHDLHDDDPGICPVALSLIRQHGQDPAATVREYVAGAGLVYGAQGGEPSRSGRALRYSCTRLRLAVEIDTGDWAIEDDALHLNQTLPDAVCTAAIDRDIRDLVEHPAFERATARITGFEAGAAGTILHYRTEALKARDLPEARARRQ